MIKEEAPNYILKPPKMRVDFPLSKRDILEPFSNQSLSMLLVGRPSSGKSSFFMSILTNKSPRIYRKVFKHIIIVCPTLDSLPSELLTSIPDQQRFFEICPRVLDL